ncbi:MAG: hypothetical protein LQ350_002990 [Teloschistes chrysophthalmus]|nr:MAG: hypothetical protein LQ350_002990 [Niorma chrysophthalma]
MPELQKRKDGDGSAGLPTSSPLIPSPQQRKHWAKQYRTEIAASSSSILSTFAAYPLDSVKTRMQAYVSKDRLTESLVPDADVE